MNTKSNIQLVIEEENIKSCFKNTLLQLVEKYSINGNVFAIDTRHNPVEITDGYFVEEHVYDNLNDCINNMTLKQAVSINEDKFILGSIHKHLSECKEDDRVLDIEYLQYIR